MEGRGMENLAGKKRKKKKKKKTKRKKRKKKEKKEKEKNDQKNGAQEDKKKNKKKKLFFCANPNRTHITGGVFAKSNTSIAGAAAKTQRAGLAQDVDGPPPQRPQMIQSALGTSVRRLQYRCLTG